MGDRVRHIGTPGVWAIVRPNGVPVQGPQGSIGHMYPGLQGFVHKLPDDDPMLTMDAAIVQSVPNFCPS